MTPQEQDHNYIIGKEFEEGVDDGSTSGTFMKTRHIVIVVCTKCGDAKKQIIV